MERGGVSIGHQHAAVTVVASFGYWCRVLVYLGRVRKRGGERLIKAPSWKTSLIQPPSLEIAHTTSNRYFLMRSSQIKSSSLSVGEHLFSMMAEPDRNMSLRSPILFFWKEGSCQLQWTYSGASLNCAPLLIAHLRVILNLRIPFYFGTLESAPPCYAAATHSD